MWLTFSLQNPFVLPPRHPHVFLIKTMIDCVQFSIFFKAWALVSPHFFFTHTMNLDSPHQCLKSETVFFHRVCRCLSREQSKRSCLWPLRQMFVQGSSVLRQLMRQLWVKMYTTVSAPPPVMAGLAVSLNGLCLSELSGCGSLLSPARGTCPDCFSRIMMPLLLWGRVPLPSRSRDFCQH